MCVFLAEQNDPIEIRELVYYRQEMGAIRRQRHNMSISLRWSFLLISAVASLVTEAANDS